RKWVSSGGGAILMGTSMSTTMTARPSNGSPRPRKGRSDGSIGFPEQSHERADLCGPKRRDVSVGWRRLGVRARGELAAQRASGRRSHGYLSESDDREAR